MENVEIKICAVCGDIIETNSMYIYLSNPKTENMVCHSDCLFNLTESEKEKRDKEFKEEVLLRLDSLEKISKRMDDVASYIKDLKKK